MATKFKENGNLEKLNITSLIIIDKRFLIKIQILWPNWSEDWHDMFSQILKIIWLYENFVSDVYHGY